MRPRESWLKEEKCFTHAFAFFTRRESLQPPREQSVPWTGVRNINFIQSRLQGKGLLLSESVLFYSSIQGGLSSPILGFSHECFIARPMCSFRNPSLCLIYEKLKWLHLRLQTLAEDSGTVQESRDSGILCAGVRQWSKAH